MFLGSLLLSGRPSGHTLGTFSQTPLHRSLSQSLGGTSASTCLVARKSAETRKKIALSPERKENESLTSAVSQMRAPLSATQRARKGLVSKDANMTGPVGGQDRQAS